MDNNHLYFLTRYISSSVFIISVLENLTFRSRYPLIKKKIIYIEGQCKMYSFWTWEEHMQFFWIRFWWLQYEMFFFIRNFFERLFLFYRKVCITSNSFYKITKAYKFSIFYLWSVHYYRHPRVILDAVRKL